MPTYRLDIEYDGTDWSGWQIQPDRPTIQEAIERALRIAVRLESISITGSGRTDAGVHASGQVAHFSMNPMVDPVRLKASLNGLLPSSIAIRGVCQVEDDFHARFQARWRRYRYRISVEPIALERRFVWYVRPEPDMEAMNTAAALFMGQHDFSSFCRTKSETTNRRCHVYEAAWSAGPYPGRWDFVVRADRFLHGMVRSMVGTLLDIGHHKQEPTIIPYILDATDRTLAGPAAPAHGLVLEAVGYDT
jgi:tRNA pseudouridine38-40 synthase